MGQEAIHATWPGFWPTVPVGMQRRVLVVAGDPLCGQLAGALRAAGHDVSVAADEAEAVLRAAEHRCEVAVLEIALPQRNGYRIAATLRPALVKVPLVIGIATEIAPPPPEALDCGMACVFVKPIDVAELLVLVGRWNPT